MPDRVGYYVGLLWAFGNLYTSQKHAGRCIGYTKLPLGVHMCMKVCTNVCGTGINPRCILFGKNCDKT